MEPFRVTILGSGSALPTKDNFHASQVLELRGRRYMIDCGEGTQIKMGQYKVNVSRLNNIFISHLHSDHCIGLAGLISTMAMLGRSEPLSIYAYKDLKNILLPILDYFTDDDSFEVIFHDINPKKKEIVYKDKALTVSTIPWKHRYAYISDTLYTESIIPQIEGVDCLFHEATFLEQDHRRAKETLHSTAIQAAQIAKKAKVKKLVIGHYSARYRQHKPFLDEARSVFENTVLAEDGLIFEL